MKDKTLIVKVDDQFIEKVDYLQRINDYKNRSDTVRKVVEKEYAIYAPPYRWIPFTTFSDWDDWEGGNRLATIQNGFGQTFVTTEFSESYIVKDLWDKKEFSIKDTLAADVPGHGVKLFRVKKG